MLITLNGEDKEIEQDIKLGELVAQLDLKGPVAAQVNDKILPREALDDHLLSEGDRVEIFLMMGGG